MKRLMAVLLGGAFYSVGAMANTGAAGAMAEMGTVATTGVNLALTIVGALLFVFALLGILMQAGKALGGKNTWGEVFVPILVMAVALVFAAWLITQGQAAAALIGT